MVDIPENTPEPMIDAETAEGSSTDVAVETPVEAPAFVPPPTPATKPMIISAMPEQADNVRDLHLLNDVQVTATVELGRTEMPIKEVLKLRRGSVVELDKLVGQPADLIINGTLIARGEVIVINERFGFRITKFLPPSGS